MLFRFQLTKPDILFINILPAVLSIHLGGNLRRRQNKLRSIKRAFEYLIESISGFFPHFFREFFGTVVVERNLWSRENCSRGKKNGSFTTETLILDLGQGFLFSDAVFFSGALNFVFVFISSGHL